MDGLKDWDARAVRAWMKGPPLELADDVLDGFEGMTGALMLEVEEEDWMKAFKGIYSPPSCKVEARPWQPHIRLL